MFTHVLPNVEEPQLEVVAVDALLDQARNAGDPFLAVTLYQRVLRARPDDASIMGEAADLMLHAGETAGAKEVTAVGTYIVVFIYQVHENPTSRILCVVASPVWTSAWPPSYNTLASRLLFCGL